MISELALRMLSRKELTIIVSISLFCFYTYFHLFFFLAIFFLPIMLKILVCSKLNYITSYLTMAYTLYTSQSTSYTHHEQLYSNSTIILFGLVKNWHLLTANMQLSL